MVFVVCLDYFVVSFQALHHFHGGLESFVYPLLDCFDLFGVQCMVVNDGLFNYGWSKC